MMKILKMVGKSYGNIYDLVLQIQSVTPSLKRITVFMNLPIDLNERMKLNRKRRERGELARQQSRLEQTVGATYAVDRMEIKMEKLSYYYTVTFQGAGISLENGR